MARKGQVILYALVSRGPTVLAEHTLDGVTGNFAAVTQQLLQKLPNEDTMLFYSRDQYYFHVLLEKGFVYLCVAEQNIGKTTPMKFLKQVKDSFEQQFGDRASSARTLAFDTDFKPTLKKLMSEVTVSFGDDKIGAVRSELDQAKQIMEKNIDKAIDRGEKLDILVDKSENVKIRAVKFNHAAREVKKQFWWQNIRMTLLVIFVVLLIIFIIIVMACGGFTFSKCKAH